MQGDVNENAQVSKRQHLESNTGALDRQANVWNSAVLVITTIRRCEFRVLKAACVILLLVKMFVRCLYPAKHYIMAKRVNKNKAETFSKNINRRTQ